MSGRYIGLEGGEGAGKTTVAKALAKLIEEAGHEAVIVREPGGTWLGEEIRRLLLHSGDMTPWAEAALFAAARAQLVAETVSPALGRGAWVISDRTYYSSLAYQGGARGLGVAEVRRLNESVLGGVLPDLVAVIDVDPAVGLSRQVDSDRIGGAGEDFQARVRSTYAMLAAEDPKVILVDGGADADAVARAVFEAL